MTDIFDLTYFRSLGQKLKNHFVHFLVQLRTRKFASEIYGPLVGALGKLSMDSVSNKWHLRIHWKTAIQRQKIYFMLS